MKNVLMLTRANLQKHKGQTLSLFIFMLIAAVLLNMGLILLFGIGSFFDERAEDNHAAHFTAIYTAGAKSAEEGRQFMKNDLRVVEIEEFDAIGGMGDYIAGDVKGSLFSCISRIYNEQKMDALSLIGEYQPLTSDAIYIPYTIFSSNNLKLGDDFILTLLGKEIHFTIAGATEEIMLGTTMNGWVRFYISDEKYKKLEEQFPDNYITLMSARLENRDDNIIFSDDYWKSVSLEGLSGSFDYYGIKASRTMVLNIAAIIVTVFAIILLAVSLILIRFRINNSIEESMINIGAQKAIGYRSVQIISAIIIQFTGIAFIGAIVGIAATQPLVPVIMNVMKPLLGLVWRINFDIVSALITFTFIIFAVILIAYSASRRISRLHPLIALRGGITTHSFRKNYLPLDKTRGNLNIIFAFKQLLRKKKQAVTITIIVAAVSMASVAGIAVNYNMNVKGENFARNFFGEIPDIGFFLEESEGSEAFRDKLREHSYVRKAYFYNRTSFLAGETETMISVTVAESCELLEGAMLVDGRYPKHNNEIALGAPVLIAADKKIGDKVTIKSGETKKEYIITGIIQEMQNGGFIGMMTIDGVYEIERDFNLTDIFVYLNEGVNSKEFINEIKEAEGDIFEAIFETDEELKATMSMFGGIFKLVAIGINAVTMFVVVLVLYMVIKTTILSRRRELGIQKAIGFTTLQLMNQIALSITPVILVGVAIGALAGFFGLNPMMAALTRSMGIVKSELPVPLDQTIIVCVALVVTAYAVSMLIALRIKKISAYALVSE